MSVQQVSKHPGTTSSVLVQQHLRLCMIYIKLRIRLAHYTVPTVRRSHEVGLEEGFDEFDVFEIVDRGAFRDALRVLLDEAQIDGGGRYTLQCEFSTKCAYTSGFVGSPASFATALQDAGWDEATPMIVTGTNHAWFVMC